ncbi:MAG: hypothetical protein K2G40_03575, partial [Muribaculaceae bacterium]|nr:hypothetical protein [Muribaculaceae bacterium]
MKKLFLLMILVIISTNLQLFANTYSPWVVELYGKSSNKVYEFNKTKSPTCYLKFGCGNATSTTLDYTASYLKLPSSGTVTISCENGYCIQEVKFSFYDITRSFSSNIISTSGKISDIIEEPVPEFGSYSGAYQLWEPTELNTVNFSIINGDIDDSTQTRLVGIIITLADKEEPTELPVGPVPVLDFDAINNTISFSIPDGFTEDFLDRIYYCWKTEDGKPSKEDLKLYTGPVMLDNKENYYIWAMTKGNEEYQNSDLEMVGHTKHRPSTYKPSILYNNRENTFTLSHVNNEDYSGYIEYYISENDIEPDEESIFIRYEDTPIQLSGDRFYIWARCVGDENYSDSELEKYGPTVYKPYQPAPKVEYSFNNIENILTLSISDENFNGSIKYFVSQSEELPIEAEFKTYVSPIHLANEVNFIWVYSDDDSEYSKGNPELITTGLLPLAPTPSLYFDELSNILTLSVEDESFSGMIDYYISETDTEPEDNVILSQYNKPIVLERDINYVWAKCSGDSNFRDSKLTLIGKTSRKILQDAPLVSYDFDEDNNTVTLMINNEFFKGHISYIVTDSNKAPEGSYVANSYSVPIQLTETHNFIWYKTCGDQEFKDSDLKMIEVRQRSVAPTPTLKFDPIKNIITLSVDESYDVIIEYIILQDSKDPTPDAKIETYYQPVELTEPVNYIWARCVGKNYRESKFMNLDVTEKFEPEDAPNVIFNFDEHHNIFSLSVDKSNFKGDIWYFVTKDKSHPVENQYQVYEPGTEIQLDDELHYVWVFTSGDENFKNSQPRYFTANYNPLPPSPVPSFSFDDTNNVLTLTLDNSEFKGCIEYALSETLNISIEDLQVYVYNGPIKLTSTSYYIWARCTGDDNFEPGDLINIGRTQLKILKEAPEIITNYNEHTGILELSIDDSEFTGNIAYIVTERNSLDNDKKYMVYNGPIELK